MARIDYFAIEEAIAAQLRADASLNGVTITVEQEPKFGEGNKVIIYLLSREAPAELQSLSAGLRTRYEITYVAVCASVALSLEDAMETRDDLLGNVETSLMTDHTFGLAAVRSSWLMGGDFANARDGDEGLFSATAEVEIIVDATAIAT